MQTVTSLEFWIPALPKRALSPNGGKRSRRDPWEVAEAKTELGDFAWHALREAHGPNVPTLTPPVRVMVVLYAKHGTKNGDGLYRPEDAGNVGGDVLKPILDYAVVRHGVVPDDDYRNVETVTLAVRHVEDNANEGIWVRIDEVVA
jgi:hypothetical protein